MESTLHIPAHAAFSIAVVAVLATAGLVLYVWRVRGALGRRDQAVLVSLRVVALAGVVAAYLQPAVRTEEVVRGKSVILVMVDDSVSMGALAAGGATRAETVAQFFRDHGRWFETLEQGHDVRYLVFSDGAPRPVAREALEAPMPAEGPSTGIVEAIREAAMGLSPGDAGGVLVFSDGIDHGELSRSVAPAGAILPSDRAAMASLPGPTWAFVPPPASPVADVALGRVDGLGLVLARNLAEVRAEVHATGIESGTLAVTLSERGVVLSRAEVTVEEALHGAVARLTFLPREPGRRALDVSVSPMPGEVSYANNARTFVVDVVRDRTRVLHVAGHPSWDQRFLGDYLRRRGDFEHVSFHTLRAPDVPVASPDDETTLIPFPADDIFVKQIDSFDLVVLQDYDLPEVDRDRYAQAIARYVQDGGALLVVGGSFSLGARGPWPTRLDPILPMASPRASGHGMLEGHFTVEVPPEGARHPALADQRLADLVERAPDLPALNPVGGVESGATVLLRAAPADPSGTAIRYPLVVVAEVGRGRVAVVLTDTLWRWSFDPFFDELYRRTLDGLTGWLTRDPASAPLRVTARRARVAQGREQRAVVEAAGEVSDVHVFAVRDGLGSDAPRFPLQPVDGAPGESAFRPPEAGTWRLLASGTMGQAAVEAADLFVAGPSPEETGVVMPGTAYLTALARATGGGTLSLPDPDLDAVALRPEVVARLAVQADRPVWNHPIVLLLLVLVLGVEWYIERKIGYT